jgi:hypothetical protein
MNRFLTFVATWIVIACGLGGPSLQARKTPSWVEERIREFREAPAMRWTTIPWVGSLVEARRLSREEGRPVLLFTHDGNIETGRC